MPPFPCRIRSSPRPASRQLLSLICRTARQKTLSCDFDSANACLRSTASRPGMLCSKGSDRLIYPGLVGMRGLRTIFRLLPILLLAACGQQAGYYGPGGRIEIGADGGRRPTHFYPPPGPAEDPWGPYIHEASARYRVPERWVRAVMQQESGGEQQATSSVGAMGLMQVIPATYEELRVRPRLPPDPDHPPHNILPATPQSS